MHREGHVGIGFLLYAPFAYLFVDLGWMLAFAFGTIAMGVWSFAPDIDMSLPISHRGPTHSVTFASLAGVLTAIFFGYAAAVGIVELASVRGWSPIGAIAFAALIGFTVGFVGVCGHIAGDALTPMGVRPFWPRSNRHYSLDLVYAADKAANKNLSIIGAVALTTAIMLAELN